MRATRGGIPQALGRWRNALKRSARKLIASWKENPAVVVPLSLFAFGVGSTLWLVIRELGTAISGLIDTLTGHHIGDILVALSTVFVGIATFRLVKVTRYASRIPELERENKKLVSEYALREQLPDVIAAAESVRAFLEEEILAEAAASAIAIQIEQCKLSKLAISNLEALEAEDVAAIKSVEVCVTNATLAVGRLKQPSKGASLAWYNAQRDQALSQVNECITLCSALKQRNDDFMSSFRARSENW